MVGGAAELVTAIGAAAVVVIGAVAAAVIAVVKSLQAMRETIGETHDEVQVIRVQTDGRLSTLIEINEKLQDRVDVITHALEHSDTAVPANGLAVVEESLQTKENPQ